MSIGRSVHGLKIPQNAQITNPAYSLVKRVERHQDR